MTADPRITIPLDDAGRPDLQALIERAGRRHAAAIGEEYVEDPFKRPPHQAIGTSHRKSGPNTIARWLNGKQREGRRDDCGSGLSG